MRNVVRVLQSGRLSYASGLKLQNCIVNFMKNTVSQNDTLAGILILTEHNPVYTVGIRNTCYGPEYAKNLRDLGAEFFETNRGGLVTFHGPGQLVSYPILNLTKFQPSVRWYVKQLENTIINVCKEYGLMAYTSPYTGVWVNDKKICAMGIHVSENVTSHGLALNCNTDLNWFKHIIPCGIEDKTVTSLTLETGKDVSIAHATSHFLAKFADQFGCTLENCTPDFFDFAFREIK